MSSSPSFSPPSSSPRRPLPVAAVAQLRSTSDKFQNLLDVASCARLAKEGGAKMLFLPECFGFMGESSEQTLMEAEDPKFLLDIDDDQYDDDDDGGNNDNNYNNNINDPTVTEALISAVREGKEDVREAPAAVSTAYPSGSAIPSPQVPVVVRSLLDGLRTIARESGLWISGGGIHVAGAPPDPESASPRVYNTHVVMDDVGVTRCTYRKIHLFDVAIPGKVSLRESKTTAPGTELVVCDSPLGKLGISTCYDVRFPEMYLPLVSRGAQILLVPSAFTVPTGAAHWHTLLTGE
jgi:predicted amidohydrolase